MTKFGFQDEEECARARDAIARQWYPHLPLNFPEASQQSAEVTNPQAATPQAATPKKQKAVPGGQNTNTAAKKARVATPPRPHNTFRHNLLSLRRPSSQLR